MSVPLRWICKSILTSMTLPTLIGCWANTNSAIAPVPTPSTNLCDSSPSPLPKTEVSSSNINGRWYVTNVDSAPGPIDGCNIRPKFAVDITQSASKVSAVSVQLADGGNGIIRFEEKFELDYIDGILAGSSLEKSPYSEGERHTYSLRFNAATSHLEGTRDGTKVYFIPLVFATPCGETKPGCVTQQP